MRHLTDVALAHCIGIAMRHAAPQLLYLSNSESNFQHSLKSPTYYFILVPTSSY